jgi:endogenous inhibitor of DNA gyrase (YacG/DUF329 family)
MPIKKCINCGIDFEVSEKRKNVAKYCSHKCYMYNKSKFHGVNICKTCKKEFSVVDHTKKRKFCSKECYWESKKKKKYEYKCTNCNKKIEKKQKNLKNVFCSRECYFEQKTKNKKIFMRNCQNCCENFIVPKQNNYSQIFCSRECYFEYKKQYPIIQINERKRIIKKCETCGKEFEVHVYRKDSAKFCSVTCLYKSGYNQSKFSIDVYDNLKKIYPDLDAEKCLRFKDKRLFPDIIYKNNIIECYGDFWHCNPKIYDDLFFNKKSKSFSYEIWEHDKKRIDFLKENNYNILIIWEHEWKTNKEKIFITAKEFLKNGIC